MQRQLQTNKFGPFLITRGLYLQQVEVPRTHLQVIRASRPRHQLDEVNRPVQRALRQVVVERHQLRQLCHVLLVPGSADDSYYRVVYRGVVRLERERLADPALLQGGRRVWLFR